MLVRRYGFDLAAVISASHNPYQDNGIKFFDARRAASSPTRSEAAIEAQRARGRRARAGADRPRAAACAR